MAENGESSQNAERISDRETQNAVLFGKYEVGKLLGYGASAKVYQGKDLRSGDGVAIKVVKKQKLVQKGGLSAPVTREISIMRRLRHPHIVRLIEVLATKSKVYFIMELAKGGELFDKVSKGRFGENLSRHYFQQLISAVRYCHGRGVFHRDLKPENLLLDENRKLKVSDFGLSAMREQMRQGEDGMMLLHTLCGTPAYVAPEILAGAKKGYDGAKADVWSCGVILFVLNAGYLPFNDTNLMSLYRKIYRGKFRVPTWTSASLFRLISRLLDPNPQTRIAVEEILLDPWFKQGTTNLNEIVRFQSDDFDLDEYNTTKQLNAFDIISSSSGLNLSGLFGNAITPDHCEQFVSDETPEEIIEKVEEVAKGMNLRIGKKKARAIKVIGARGLFTVVVKLHRLTDDLVIVEIKNKESHRDVGIMWAEALRQKIRSLVSQPNTSQLELSQRLQ